MILAKMCQTLASQGKFKNKFNPQIAGRGGGAFWPFDNQEAYFSGAECWIDNQTRL